MAKQKITRKALLKSPDEFLTFTDKALNFVRDRARYFHIAGIIVVAAALVYLGITTYLNYANKRGLAAYYAAYSEIRNEKPDLEKGEALFRKVEEDYTLARVSRLAAPQIGYLKYRDRQYDEAVPFYETFMNKSSENSPYRTLAKLALAALYEEKGEVLKAIDLLDDLASAPGNVFMEQTLLSLGRLYRASGQEDKAGKVYKEFSDRFTTSPFAGQVKAYLNQPS
jgi:outer membrane protein assembly factor BamD (BamD/ComL family)